MIVIADSGSTKTAWRFIMGGEGILKKNSAGMNPALLDVPTLSAIAADAFALVPGRIPTKIYFYGAGCKGDTNITKIKQALAPFVGVAPLFVESDMLGAARALCMFEPGMVAILGTGSNSAFYDGNELEKNVPPLGYLLGDEGSAKEIGRFLLADYFRGLMPVSLRSAFANKFKPSQTEILAQVRSVAVPGQFMGQFAPFLDEFREHPYCRELIRQIFTSFIERNLLLYAEAMQYPVHFAGTVAKTFEPEITALLKSRHIEPGNFSASVIDLLTDYHQKKIS